MNSGIAKSAGFARNEKRRNSLFAWFGDHGGAAAVEFAFLAPLILVVLAGISDGASLVLKQSSMHSGVSSSAQYIMSGGADLATAKSVGLSSWPARSDKSTFSATKLCYCGSVVSDCTALCTDATAPKAYVTIAASDYVDGWYIKTTVSAQQEVRTR